MASKVVRELGALASKGDRTSRRKGSQVKTITLCLVSGFYTMTLNVKGRDHRQGEGKEEVETVGKEKVKKVRRCRQRANKGDRASPPFVFVL